MPRLFLLFLACCGSALLFGQAVSRDKADTKALKDYEAGAKAAYLQDYRQAIRFLEAAITREPNFADAIVELAGVYYAQERFAEAETYLERVAALGGREGAEVLYGLAMAELKQNKYAEAATHLERYLKEANPRPDRQKAAERYLADAAFRAEALTQPRDYQRKRLSDAVNSASEADYLPSLSADGKTLVFTRRVGNRQEDFFISHLDSNGQWGQAEALSGGVNTPDNEGAQSLSADGKWLVFTACDRRDGLGSCDLYESQLLNGQWTKARNLGAPVNSKAWESQPSLSANGNLLFFASKRDGGKGGADLYASARGADGRWTNPVHLGDVLNTPLDEQSPFFHADGRTLYFMSNGHPGLGGFDLFLSRLDSNNQWQKPENLGHPLNTEGNEGALVVGLDGKTAWYASDIEASDASEEMGVGGQRGKSTDLYTFQLPEDLRASPATFLRARVRDAISLKPVPALARIQDLDGDKTFMIRRADSVEGSFLVVLPIFEAAKAGQQASAKTYGLSVEADGYVFYSDRFELNPQSSVEQPYELIIDLQPLPSTLAENDSNTPESPPVVLRNVQFASNSAALKPESRSELERLLALLASNSSLRIRLQGHTDDIGEENDNLQLSQRRADAVKSWLLANGIEAERLETRGFGESRPLLPNDSDANRALNRRTEFVIL